MAIDLSWHRKQVNRYARAFPLYKAFAATLQRVLGIALTRLAACAIVQARPKTIASFAEKAIRKHDKYNDPVNQLTDLCGARVIVHTHSEVEKVCMFIRDNFEIDEANSNDAASLLRTNEFGYRAVHLIAAFKPGVFPNRDVHVSVPRRVFGKKSEVQVRTILQHAWADIGHDRIYKSKLSIPERWKREAARVAAVLEEADNAFSRVVGEVDAHRVYLNASQLTEEICEEIAVLQCVLKRDRKNVSVAHRIGVLAMALADWRLATQTMAPFYKRDYQPLLRDYGVTLLNDCGFRPSNSKYRRGRLSLQRAVELDATDVEALTSLASSYARNDRAKAIEMSERAFLREPTNPTSLACFLEQRIANKRTVSFVPPLQPILEEAITVCERHVNLGMNLPEAYLRSGYFQLLLRRPFKSLEAYAKAVQLSTSEHLLEAATRTVEQLCTDVPVLPESEWVRRLLLLGRAVRFQSRSARRLLAEQVTKRAPTISAPIVIVAGASDGFADYRLRSYRRLLLSAFDGFKGTIISGGTTKGVGGIAGVVGLSGKTSIHTIGYVPYRLPPGSQVDQTPNRYREIRRTPGDDFSPLQPLQYWIDLIASGIPAQSIKLLGIGGGNIAALEFQIALALGAQVALVRGSGGQADSIGTSQDRTDSTRLIFAPCDLMTLKTFVQTSMSTLPPEIRERIGVAIHFEYQGTRCRDAAKSDPSMADWNELEDNLKESNRLQADDIERKLHSIGCTMIRVKDREIVQMKFSRREIETMAQMEHARWNLERLLDGWRLGEKKDAKRKISPYLVAWADLPEDVRNWDRRTVEAIPSFLENIDIEVRRVNGPGRPSRQTPRATAT